MYGKILAVLFLAAAVVGCTPVDEEKNEESANGAASQSSSSMQEGSEVK